MFMMFIVIFIKVDGQANQVGQGHAQIHEREVQKDLPGPRSSFLEEDVGENNEKRAENGETARHSNHSSHGLVLYLKDNFSRRHRGPVGHTATRSSRIVVHGYNSKRLSVRDGTAKSFFLHTLVHAFTVRLRHPRVCVHTCDHNVPRTCVI